MDYTRFLNDLALRREPLILREMAKYLFGDFGDLVYLGGGVPNESVFPLIGTTLKLRDGTSIEIDGENIVKAQQYGLATGCKEFVDQLKQMTIKYHKPPRFEDSEVVVTSGSQQSINMLFEIMIKEGDHVIIPEPIFTGILSSIEPHQVKCIGIPEDEEGMRADILREKLQPFKDSIWKRDTDAPKVMYVNPTGGNPSGKTMTLKRRKEIYKIAQEYNLLIIEDDAYFFVNFLEERVPSFLSMDVDGRVLRTDSFSKIIAPGLRLGFTTGPKPILKVMDYILQVTVQQPSSLSQIVTSQILSQWGEDGFLQQAESVCKFYKNQRDLMLKYATKWLKDLAVWSEPSGGMFLWIKVLGFKDTKKLALETAVKKGVVVVPGRFFLTEKRNSPYIRISYASITDPQKLDKAFRGLAEAITEELSIQNSRITA